VARSKIRYLLPLSLHALSRYISFVADFFDPGLSGSGDLGIYTRILEKRVNTSRFRHLYRFLLSALDWPLYVRCGIYLEDTKG